MNAWNEESDDQNLKTEHDLKFEDNFEGAAAGDQEPFKLPDSAEYLARLGELFNKFWV